MKTTFEEFLKDSIEYLFEDFKIKNKTLYFDANHSGMNINTSLGKSNFKPRVSTIKELNMKIYTVYSKLKDKEYSSAIRNILTSLKGKGPFKIDAESYNRFISRTAIFFYKLLQYEKIDIILTIESSSGISNDLKVELLKHLPYDVLVFDEGVKKNVEYAEYVIDDSKIAPSTVKSLQKVINDANKTGYFKIQEIYPQYRKFIKNWLKVDDEIKEKIVGKNILIIDDFLTTGSTIYETGRMLNELGVESIVAITIIK